LLLYVIIKKNPPHLQIMNSFGAVVAAGASEGLLLGMPVEHVAGQGRPSRASHVTLGAPMVVTAQNNVF
jgi:hypothetical protein